jgi:hypothetical protein
MAFDFQVTIDCSAPHVLADWWAEALGWQVEKQDEAFIRRMVESGAASEADTTEHRGALVWKVGTGLLSPDPGRPRVLFQAVPEAKTVKNRMHLDVRVGAEHREAEVARLIGLGATELWRAAQGPFEWVTLADPEGNEFCVT